jgi:hypothetical protein
MASFPIGSYRRTEEDGDRRPLQPLSNVQPHDRYHIHVCYILLYDAVIGTAAIKLHVDSYDRQNKMDFI